MKLLIQTFLLALVISLAPSMEGLAQVPIKKNPRTNSLNAQYHRAETAWKSGNSLLEAKARVDRVLTELPDDEEALKLRARILLSMDRYELAYDDARKAAELLPADAEAFAILIEAARKSGRIAMAEEAMESVSGMIIDDAQLQIHLSREAMALQQFNRAEAFARTAMIQAPNDPTTYFQMARVFAVQNKLTAARTILDNGLDQGILTRESIESDAVLQRVLVGAIDD